MEIITLITPTGDRPLPFALCQHWMKKQTKQPEQWIVVDDGKVPMKPFVPMQHVRREPEISDPKFTLLLNIKTALSLITGNKILIIEDDEYYAPKYIETMAAKLDEHEVVGIGRNKYYHLPSGGYFKHKNTTHASLAETGFRRSFLPEVESLLKEKNLYLDLRVWRKAGKNGRGFIFVDSDENPLYVGMKGLPGRPGIGVGHNPALYIKYFHDTTRKMLEQWIPKDYEIYLDILNGKLTEENCQSWFKKQDAI